MSNILRTYTFVLVCILSFFRVTASEKYSLGTHSEMEKIEWDNSLILPALDGNLNIGVAGAFSGFIENHLVVAGGANFPDATPWKGGY